MRLAIDIYPRWPHIRGRSLLWRQPKPSVVEPLNDGHPFQGLEAIDYSLSRNTYVGGEFGLRHPDQTPPISMNTEFQEDQPLATLKFEIISLFKTICHFGHSFYFGWTFPLQYCPPCWLSCQLALSEKPCTLTGTNKPLLAPCFRHGLKRPKRRTIPMNAPAPRAGDPAAAMPGASTNRRSVT